MKTICLVKSLPFCQNICQKHWITNHKHKIHNIDKSNMMTTAYFEKQLWLKTLFWHNLLTILGCHNNFFIKKCIMNKKRHIQKQTWNEDYWLFICNSIHPKGIQLKTLFCQSGIIIDWWQQNLNYKEAKNNDNSILGKGIAAHDIILSKLACYSWISK